MKAKRWAGVIAGLLGAMLIGTAHANIPSVPDELYEALKLDREKATPKEVYEAVVKRYKDPEQG
ncbi:hydroxylamine dehydrogenase, partial [Nitrosomonas ureae]